MNLFAKQKYSHRCRKQTYSYQGEKCRAGREWDIQTSTKADGKGAGLGPALESGQLGCCGAGCWGLTRGNMQLLMGKALCGQHGQNLVVCLSKK